MNRHLSPSRFFTIAGVINLGSFAASAIAEFQKVPGNLKIFGHL